MLNNVMALLSGLAVGACSVVGIRSGTEEPPYRVTATVGQVEIRVYEPRLAAETTVPGDEYAARSAGFSRLAAYIFGANHGKAKIAMTAPVAQERAGASEKIAMTAPVGEARDAEGSYVIRFFMPSGYTLATLPVPDDPQVRLVEVPAETIAALRYSGVAGPETVAEKQSELGRSLDGSAWKPLGTQATWFYDPPWTIPFLRRNEAVVAVGVH